MGWFKKLKSSKCWWGQCVLVMRAIFRIYGNKSQSRLLLVTKLATPLLSALDRDAVGCLRLYTFCLESGWPNISWKSKIGEVWFNFEFFWLLASCRYAFFCICLAKSATLSVWKWKICANCMGNFPVLNSSRLLKRSCEDSFIQGQPPPKVNIFTNSSQKKTFVQLCLLF